MCVGSCKRLLADWYMMLFVGVCCLLCDGSWCCVCVVRKVVFCGVRCLRCAVCCMLLDV